MKQLFRGNAYDRFEIARRLWIGASDMSRIEADDELAERIIRHSEFKSFALACHWRICPLLPERLLLQARANFQRSIAYRHMAFRRFNRQEFGQELRGLAVRQHAPQARGKFHEFRRGPIWANPVENRERHACVGEDNAGKASFVGF